MQKREIDVAQFLMWFLLLCMAMGVGLIVLWFAIEVIRLLR